MNYIQRQLNEFILKHYNDEELHILCAVDFRVVSDSFTPNMSKKRRVFELVDWCVVRNAEVQKLLTILQQERPKPFNSTFGQSLERIEVESKTVSTSLKSAGDFIPDPPDIQIHSITGKEMIRIPGGLFFYGEVKQKVVLPEFWEARTPITNADFKIL